MNIKRIIREELEGFKDSSQEDWEWAKGEVTEPFKLYLNDYEYVGVVVNDKHEDNLTQEGFHNIGYTWYSKLKYRDIVEEENLTYPYTLWVDETKMLMFSNDADNSDLADEEIILDNPFV